MTLSESFCSVTAECAARECQMVCDSSRVVRATQIFLRFLKRAIPGFLAVLAFSPTPAQAQLNENCVISILNRTAQVQPDGSWRIANVPGSFGSLRARATCVEGGVTVTGESSLIAFQAGIANGFDAEIGLGAVTPIPESLAVSAPAFLGLELPQ